MLRTFLCLFVALGLLEAQEAVRVIGRVTDPAAAPVGGARVRLFRADAGETAQTLTDDGGAYAFPRLAAGRYLLEVERDGFRGVTREVTTGQGEAVRVDVQLTLAGVSETVMVTAAGAPQQVEEISKAASVVTAGEIEARDEFSLSEILRTTPGMLVTNGGGPGQNTSLKVRGLRADATAVLIDGMRFRDATTTQGDASSQLQALNFIAADRVEVLRGSGSSLYGTNAVGGVVNVVTAEGGGPVRGQWLTEGGSLGLFRTRAAVSGGAFGDRLRYTAGLLHLNVMAGVDGQDANRSSGGQGFVRYDLTPRLMVSARLWGSDDFVQTNSGPTASGLPAGNIPATGVIPARVLSPANVALLAAGRPFDATGSTLIPGVNDPDSRRGSRFLTAAFLVRQTLSARASWQASYQRNHSSRVYQNGPAGTGYQPLTSDWSRYAGDIDTAAVRATGQPAGWLTLTGGYEFERENYFDAQRNNLPAPDRLETETRVRQDSHAAWFASQASLLGKRLQLSFSGRAQGFRLGRPAFRFEGTANNYAQSALPAPPTALTGDVSAAYLLARTNTKLRAHFGNAYRAPSLYERFGAGFYTDYFSGQVVFSPYGDPRLAPDRYNSVDAGVDQYLFGNRLRVSSTFFYTRVVSITAFDSAGVVTPATDPYGRYGGYINGSGGLSRGVELAAEARPWRSLTVSGSYTYTRAGTDRDITVPGSYRIFGVPAHMATLVATRQWTRRIDTTFDLFRSGGYTTAFYAGSGSRAFAFPGYTKADLGAGYLVRTGERMTVRLYGKVENVLNQRYYQNGWLAARATVVTGLAVRF